MPISGLKGPAGKPSAPNSVAVFGIAAGFCAVAAVILAAGQWLDSAPGSPPDMAEYVPALLLAALGVLGAILCAGFACLIAAVSRCERSVSNTLDRRVRMDP